MQADHITRTHIGDDATMPDGPMETLFCGLRRVLGDADVSHLPDLLGRLESERLRAETRLRRLTTPVAAVATSRPETEELMTLPQVAGFLGVPEDYAYTLARQRKLPTVRLPGLGRGGRATTGKYVRVRRAELVAWLSAHVEKVLDGSEPPALLVERRAARAARRKAAPQADARTELSSGVAAHAPRHGSSLDFNEETR